MWIVSVTSVPRRKLPMIIRVVYLSGISNNHSKKRRFVEDSLWEGKVKILIKIIWYVWIWFFESHSFCFLFTSPTALIWKVFVQLEQIHGEKNWKRWDFSAFESSFWSSVNFRLTLISLIKFSEEKRQKKHNGSNRKSGTNHPYVMKSQWIDSISMTWSIERHNTWYIIMRIQDVSSPVFVLSFLVVQSFGSGNWTWSLEAVFLLPRIYPIFSSIEVGIEISKNRRCFVSWAILKSEKAVSLRTSNSKAVMLLPQHNKADSHKIYLQH